MTEIQEMLFALQDKEYKEFQSKLIPEIDPDTVIGVRIPQLRKLAKQLYKERDMKEFLKELPHTYYEENNLHGFLLEQIKDFETCAEEINRFLPYVDNWATCDLISPAVFKKNRPKLLGRIRQWMSSGDTYTIRFGMGMLMKHYLDDDFSEEYPAMAAAVKSEEYYVKMMTAWYFATALAKQYDAVIGYIEEQRLDKWTHNKTIQKAVESRRISDEQKKYLRTLRR